MSLKHRREKTSQPMLVKLHQKIVAKNKWNMQRILIITNCASYVLFSFSFQIVTLCIEIVKIRKLCCSQMSENSISQSCKNIWNPLFCQGSPRGSNQAGTPKIQIIYRKNRLFHMMKACELCISSTIQPKSTNIGRRWQEKIPNVDRR